MDYKEKLEEAKRLYETANADQKYVLESLFPEIRESEDEKIIKMLVYIVNITPATVAVKNRQTLLAWLEKQGEQKECTPLFRVGDTLKKKGKEYTFIVDRIQGGFYHCDHNKGAFFPIEEQDSWELVEQKPAAKMPVSDELYEHIRNTCACIDDAISCCSVKDMQDYLAQARTDANIALDMVKQKPADKVEPKFKAGDWITNGRYNKLIVGIIGDWYMFEDGTSKRIKDIAKKYHLWTLQDAKDGDVLTYRDGEWVFIFKNMTNDTTFKYYALISEKDFAINDSAYTALPSCIVPATKIQRNLLFQKIKEAGYEWNTEKKN